MSRNTQEKPVSLLVRLQDLMKGLDSLAVHNDICQPIQNSLINRTFVHFTTPREGRSAKAFATLDEAVQKELNDIITQFNAIVAALAVVPSAPAAAAVGGGAAAGGAGASAAAARPASAAIKGSTFFSAYPVPAAVAPIVSRAIGRDRVLAQYNQAIKLVNDLIKDYGMRSSKLLMRPYDGTGPTIAEVELLLHFCRGLLTELQTNAGNTVEIPPAVATVEVEFTADFLTKLENHGCSVIETSWTLTSLRHQLTCLTAAPVATLLDELKAQYTEALRLLKETTKYLYQTRFATDEGAVDAGAVLVARRCVTDPPGLKTLKTIIVALEEAMKEPAETRVSVATLVEPQLAELRSKALFLIADTLATYQASLISTIALAPGAR